MKIGFIGLGKLGKDVAEVIHDAGYNIVGYDIKKVDSYIKIADNLKEACFGKDIVFIAVQTPHHPDYDGRYPTNHLKPKDFDYSIVKNVIKKTDKFLSKKTLLVLISTVLPGTVRREISKLVKKSRFIYNPYLIAQGTVKYDMKNPEMVIIGTKDGSITGDAKILKKFYSRFVNKKTRYEIGTWDEAEGIKIFYNTFITAKLCIVNMIQDVAELNGNINVDVITNALQNSKMRIMGPKYMKAGFGDGGGCHPRDNIALRWMAKKLKMSYDLFSSIMWSREKQAENMAKYVAKFKKDVVILGEGFKPGIDQKEGSPSILVSYYLKKINKAKKVFFDKNPDQKKSYVYLIHHYDQYKNFNYYKNSIIVDPYRKFTSHRKDLKIFHYGNTRLKK